MNAQVSKFQKPEILKNTRVIRDYSILTEKRLNSWKMNQLVQRALTCYTETGASRENS